MALIKITVLPENKVIEVDPATMPYHEHGLKGSILDILIHHDVHLEHACGGSCACTTCHVFIRNGAENVSEAQDEELDRLDMAPGLELSSRLGCQVIPKGRLRALSSASYSISCRQCSAPSAAGQLPVQSL